MKLAIVIPWFGRELKGGAEQQAWQIASRLSAHGHDVDVLTTCCRSHQDDWATNHLPAGESTEPEGFRVRRFPVTPRDRASFDRVCGPLMNLETHKLKRGVSPISPEEASIFVNELIKSPELLECLAAQRTQFDWFLFLPYLYGPVLHGISLVGDRAALQPCLHNEAYAYLPQVADAFHLAAKLLFNSDGELELALRLFGPGIWKKSTVVGEGVETPPDAGRAPDRNGATSRKPGRYVLYLGRKEEGKNTPLLVRAFQRFKAARPNSDLRLLLAGHGTVELNAEHAGIEDLSVVAGDEKELLLRDCTALFQPSEKESFSRVMMEAWMHRRPVAAHAECLATAAAVQRSGGGWLAGSEDDWAALFAQVAGESEFELSRLGEQGRQYASDLANWDRVMERYEAALPTKSSPGVVKTRAKRGSSAVVINQFLPNLSFGDAISNYAIWMRNEIRARGWRSDIHVRHFDPAVANECTLFSPAALRDSTAAIYHHSIDTEITPQVANFLGPKCLIYHNITPAEFFEPYRPDFAPMLRRGREQLRELAPHFLLSYGISEYNAAELRECGFRDPGILPIAVDPQKWNFPADAALMAALQDGKTNILFVGRIAPNKKQEDLVTAFNDYLPFDPGARLILVGKAEENDPYATHLQEVISALQLQDSVLTPGSITDAQLAACYRTADLFWSMSEHEGFCVPLIEAMWFDVPVFAYRSSAVPETLGPGGLLFTEKRDQLELPATAALLTKRSKVRDAVLKQQRHRREHYLPEYTEISIQTLLSKLVYTGSQQDSGASNGSTTRS